MTTPPQWAYETWMTGPDDLDDDEPPLHPDTLEMGRLRGHLSALQALARCPTITLAALQAAVLATPLTPTDPPDA